MDNWRPRGVRYVLAAVLIAIAISSTVGAPHHSPKTVNEPVKQQYADRVALP
jgi:hypothetical protein